MRGFTLVELLIYSAIVALVLTVSIVFVWQIIEGNIKTDAYREVSQNNSFALAKIITTTRNSSGIIQPAEAGNQTDYLVLTMPTGPSPIEFRLANGKITIKEGSGNSYPLTSDLVEVTQLKFTNITAGSSPKTVKIEIAAKYKNPGGRPEYNASSSLEGSATMRY